MAITSGKTILYTILSIAVSLVMAIVILEIAVRLVYWRKLDYQIEMCRYAHLLKRKAADPRLAHEHIPNKQAHLMGVNVSINSSGFRDREHLIDKPADTYRILLLGDSLTLGWGVEQDKVFATLLEKLLNQRRKTLPNKKKVEIINTGIGNYNTSQEVALLEQKGRIWKPDLVILNYFINDAEVTPTEASSSILEHSYLAMWLWGRMDVLSRRFGKTPDYVTYYRSLYEPDQPGWIEEKRALARLGSLAKTDHFRLIAVLLPELHAIGPLYGFQSIHDLVKDEALRAGADDVIDLAPQFSTQNPPDLWVTPTDAHPNDKAHEIIADSIFARLSNLEWFNNGR